MFTPPSVNQIAKAYTGNAAPLNAKVEADKKQNGGIPKDLRQLMAAFDLAQNAQSMGNEQAMQVPPNMPTVAQTTQERVRQMMQARPMMQAAAPQGLNALPTNVGAQYANGGIIGFTNGGDMPSSGELAGFSGPTPEQEAREEVRASEQKRSRQIDELEKKVAFLKSAGAPQAAQAEMQLNALKGETQPKPSPTDPNFRRQTDPRMTGTPAAAVPLITSGSRPPAANVNVSADRDSAPMPGGLKDLLPAPESEALNIMKKEMRRDPEAESQALRARYMKEVGSRDLSSYDKAMKELEARKDRLNAPKTGIDSVMDLLENIAQSKGRTWQAAGAEGAINQKKSQQARQKQQDDLLDKILELGGKKSEAEYGEKKGMFEMTQAEKKSVYEKAYDAAKAVNMSDDKAKELASQAVQKELDRKNQLKAALAGNRDNLMSRAQALMAADPTKKMTLEQAMQRAAEIGAAGQMESADVRRAGNIERGIAEIDKKYGLLEALSMNPQNPKYIQMKAQRDKEVADYMARQGAGGANTSPTALPPGVTVTKVK